MRIIPLPPPLFPSVHPATTFTPWRVVAHRNRVWNTEIAELLFRIPRGARGHPRNARSCPVPSTYPGTDSRKRRGPRAWVDAGREFRGTAENFGVLELSHIDPGASPRMARRLRLKMSLCVEASRPRPPYPLQNDALRQPRRLPVIPANHFAPAVSFMYRGQCPW